MREVEKSGASVEEAVEAALEELGVSEQEADVEIVREASRGLLGLRSQEAIVRVRVVTPPIDVEDLEEQGEVAADFVEGLLDLLDIDADLELEDADGGMYVDIVGGGEGPGMGLLIGKHGQTLDALQEIVRSAVQRKTGERCRVMVDVEGYRKRRRSQLAEKARETAQRVKSTGRQHKMEPMNPYERKIVHDAVAEVGGVESSSVGEEPERRVVIRKKH